MTPRQRDVLLYVGKFFEERGYSPSQSEIARHLGVKQQSASDLVARLVRQGALRRVDSGWRNIEVAR